MRQDRLPMTFPRTLMLTSLSLIVLPVALHWALVVAVNQYGYDGNVGFPFFGVVHYLMAVLFGLVTYAIMKTRLTQRGLLVTFGLCALTGPASLFLGLPSETLTDLVMLAMLVLLVVMIRGVASMFRYAVMLLALILVSIQLIHHASMSFGPYPEDNARVKTVLIQATDALASEEMAQGSPCVYAGERIDECKRFPDMYSSGYTNTPNFVEMMTNMRLAWQNTGETQYGHFRQTTELSSQWLLRFDGQNWSVTQKTNGFLVAVYVPVLTWLFAWATFWWSLSLLCLTVWHDRSTRDELRATSPKVGKGMIGLGALHIGHYLILSGIAGHLIPTDLVMNPVRRQLLTEEFSCWFLAMAGIQAAGLILLLLVLLVFHRWHANHSRKKSK